MAHYDTMAHIAYFLTTAPQLRAALNLRRNYA
jgi:hypothetical protein